MLTSLEKLHELCREYLTGSEYRLCNIILKNPSFAQAPGGSTHHHAYVCGLADHTLEVANAAIALSRPFPHLALIAAIFHDYDKTKEYVIENDGSISSTPFRKQIGHVVWGYEFFKDRARYAGLAQSDIDAICHALLAHHGRREWGSPVEPATPLAWALHSADMLSAKGSK